MILHDIKVAVRNLMKYKFQTFISVLSIAIGIVTLAFTHSVLQLCELPPIYDEPYYNRAYLIRFKSINEDERVPANQEIIKVLKVNGGLRSAEKIAVSCGTKFGIKAEFHLMDSTVRKGYVAGRLIDPEYPAYAGLRSAVTGTKIKTLKAGEAIVSDDFAKKVLHSDNPIGAVQTLTSDQQPIPVTIVDVFKSISLIDWTLKNDEILYSTENRVEDMCTNRFFQIGGIYTVLKEGKNREDFLKEINQRIKPLNITADLSNVSEMDTSGMFSIIRPVCYIIGCLILVAAIIGFLRMHIQLIWLRRREMSLRIVNGARKRNLLVLVIVENAITLSIAVGMAVILGILLKDFLDSRLVTFMDETGVRIRDLWLYCLTIGACLFAICSLTAGVMLYKISGSKQGLAANMLRSRNQIFRNAMLGIQMLICFIFVCSSLVCINFLNKELKPMIPENDNILKECLYIKSSFAGNWERLYDEIRKSPDLDRIEMIYQDYYPIREMLDVRDKLDISPYSKIYCIKDTAMLSLLGIDVDWKMKEIDRTECLLIQDSLYRKLLDAEVLNNNALTIDGIDKGSDLTLPVAGTFGKIPYEGKGNLIIAISKRWEDSQSGWMLIPKEGRGKSLARSVNETVEKFEPEVINRMVFNYRDVNFTAGFDETLIIGCWILGSVSVIICIMGIFSTIALDTRTRKKEVAIRKINGAKSRDIYFMIGKLYVWLVCLCLLIAVPLGALINDTMESTIIKSDPGASLSPVVPILSGCLTVTIIIFATVCRQIHRMMQTDPAKIIAKE
ncbi:MAG: ABC transporter permease [Muribaculaceae bacterium]|nr:ABC transporter permease [Muribaculaceae bacterium]